MVFGSEGVEMAGNTTTRRHHHVSNNNRQLLTSNPPSIPIESEMFFDTRIYWKIKHRWLVVRFFVKGGSEGVVKHK